MDDAREPRIEDCDVVALLRAARVAPGEIARDQVEGFPLGYAFAVGRVSLGQVVERVAPHRSEVP